MSNQAKCIWLAILASAAVSRGAQTYAVVAGIDKYDDRENIISLKCSVADAKGLAESLLSAGIPDANVKLLTSDQTEPAKRPSKSNILLALQHAREKAQAGDSLWFFFAGHGMEDKDQRQFLLTSDCVYQAFNSTALAMADVRQILAGYQGQNLVFLIDACRNDPSAGRSTADNLETEIGARDMRPPLLQRDSAGQTATAALLLACDVGQRAYEFSAPDGTRHGVFTYYLLEGLGGKAKSAGGPITLRSLAQYTQNEVARWSQRNRKPQTPRFENPNNSDFVLPQPGTGPVVPPVVPPVAPTGQLTVTSDPAGAAIVIGGEVVGKAPATIKVPAGDVTVTLRLTGFEEATFQVTVPANGRRDAPATRLRPLVRQSQHGRLHLTSVPPGARVFLGGHDTGRATPCDLDLPPGDVQVQLKAPGGEVQAPQRVAVVAGRTIALPTWHVPAGNWPPANWPAFLRAWDAKMPRGLTYRLSAKDQMPQVLIPAGTFTMGSSPAEQAAAVQLAHQLGDPAVQLAQFADEAPAKAVTLRAHWLDLHPVTTQQYCQFLNETHPSDAERRAWVAVVGEKTDPSWGPSLTLQAGRYAPVAGTELCPVIFVTWAGAEAYGRWTGRHLPTEAQYEQALRGGRDGGQFPWGEALTPPAQAGNYGDAAARAKWPNWTVFSGYSDGFAGPSPVGTFAPNGYGLFDVSGNVWEWCQDYYSSAWYALMPVTEPCNQTVEARRAIRGGSCGALLRYNRVAARRGQAPAVAAKDLGFRLVDDATE